MKKLIKQFYYIILAKISAWTPIQRILWGLHHPSDAQKYWDSKENPRHRYIRKLFTDLEFKNLLEIGCNSGNILYNISQVNPSANLHGIDINRHAVLIGRQLIKKSGSTNITLEILSAESINQFGHGSFNIVLTSATLMYIRPKEIIQVLKTILKIAKDKVILIEPNGSDPINDRQGTGLFYPPNNWKRDYKKLFLTLGINQSRIMIHPIPKEIWSPSGGGATCIVVEK